MADTDKTTKHYCPEHEPCADPKHNPVTRAVVAWLTDVAVSPIWGLFLMFGFNSTADVFSLNAAMGYWDAVAIILAFQAIIHVVFRPRK